MNFSTDSEDENSKKKINLEIPSMPIALKEGETEPSDMFQRVQQTGYPQIFAKNTWTKGVLFKNVTQFYKPSECIGEKAYNLTYHKI